MERACFRGERHLSNHQEHSVFVHPAQFVDDVERVPGVVVPSVVRLQPLDHCPSLRDDLTYFSLTFGSVVVGRLADRKFRVPIVPQLGRREFPHEMVQARPELSDDFSDNHADALQIGQGRCRDHDVVTNLTFHLFRDAVVIGDQFGKFPVEIFEVLVGPFELAPDAVEWMCPPRNTHAGRSL